MVFSTLFILFTSVFANAQEISIEEKIKEAEVGDTIKLNAGEYEGNVVIDKPIHLIGMENVTLIQKDSSPVLTIKSDDVKIENLNIKHEDHHGESPAILITGHHNSLHKVNIKTTSYGIQLDGANDNVLSHLHIAGDEQVLMGDRQHGIDVWESHRNEIRHTTIHNVQDGIYVERSNETKIDHNTVYQSRYGYHLMFTKDTVLERNESYENVSGMYIMGDEGTTAKHNTLKDNQENVQSLGLLLFDTKNAVITNNDIVNNRVGILIESASENKLALNNVQGNFIGVQFERAMNNEIVNNSFVANVVQGQAKESSDNNTNQNYWGDHLGLDITGDETSDLAYKVDPFFLNIVNEYPAFQLLFQAPGMVFLEQLIHTPVDEQLVDESPLMDHPLTASDNMSEHSFTMVFVCMMFIIFSIYIIYLGVKSNEKI